ncbi:hypothetical protein M436DRAFT_63303 [Aureobasidium namibiae CBS 147.97]|uniref:Uncharacterized protein n=1 Tax=Aureobasidium namibiae CBS 147.97 TaxID=1043004 RepID=A0A074WQS6_9PEZI
MKSALLILSSAALALAGPIIPTMVYDLPTISTSTDKPLRTIIEELREMPACAMGVPPQRYPHGCCDYMAGNCILRFHDPHNYLEHVPEEAELAARAPTNPIIPTMVPDSEIPAISTSTDKPLPTMNVNEGSWPPRLALCVEGEPPSKYPRGCCEHYIGELCVQERFNPPDEDPEHEPRPTHRFYGERPRHTFICARGDPPHDLDPCDNWWEQVNFDEEFEREAEETETARV